MIANKACSQADGCYVCVLLLQRAHIHPASRTTEQSKVQTGERAGPIKGLMKYFHQLARRYVARDLEDSAQAEPTIQARWGGGEPHKESCWTQVWHLPVIWSHPHTLWGQRTWPGSRLKALTHSVMKRQYRKSKHKRFVSAWNTDPGTPHLIQVRCFWFWFFFFR